MLDNYTGPADLPVNPVPDDMPEHGVPIFLSVGDRPAHYIGWVGDGRIGTLAALLRTVADEYDGGR